MLLGIVVMLATAQPASAACSGLSALFGGCKTPPPTTAPAPAPAPAPVPAPVPQAPAAPAPFDPAAATQRLLDLTNQARAAVGLGPLTQRADVFEIAEGHSRAMASAGTIWHNEAYLTQPVRAALAAAMLGENVGMGGSVDQIHDALMLSPGHKANILEPKFSVVGIAVVRSADGAVYITQDFVQPNGQQPKAVARSVSTSKAAPKPAAPKAASRPRVASAPRPKPAAPATTAPAPAPAPPTTVEDTTTTTEAPQPDPSVLAAMAGAPRPAPGPPADESGNALAELLALALLFATASGALRLRRQS